MSRWLGEEGNSGTRKDFLEKYQTFRKDYLTLWDAVAAGSLPAKRAKELICYDYQNLRYHPYAGESLENLDTLSEGIDLAEEDALKLPQQHRAKTQQYIVEKREEIPQPIEQPAGIGYWLAGAGGFAAAQLGFMLEKRGLPVTEIYGMALGTAVLAYGVNKYMSMRKTQRASHDTIPSIPNKFVLRAAAGLISIAALLGTMTGQLPQECSELMQPHKAVQVLEQSPPFIISDDCNGQGLYSR